jgi:type VI secretion system protein ImpH
LPGRVAINQLRALVRQYVGFEFAWDLRLVLARADVPRWALGGRRDPQIGTLGRTAWIAGRAVPRRTGDARDLVMNVESIRIEPADGGSNTKGESCHE